MRRIALVGTATSRAAVPFNDESIEIWGVGNRGHIKNFPRADRWFELHRLNGEPPEWAKEWRKEIKTWPQDCDIYMFYPEHDLSPRVKHFVPQQLAEKYGTFFMTSSFSWMMAMAIEEITQVKGQQGEILLYGVDMEYGTEYAQQRIGLRHFIQVAKHFGITVTRLADSGIAYEPIPYPLWQDDPLLSKLKLRTDIIDEKLTAGRAIQESLKSMIDETRGRLRAFGEVQIEGFDVVSQVKIASDYLDELEAKFNKNAENLARMEGTIDEQKWLADYLKP